MSDARARATPAVAVAIAEAVHSPILSAELRQSGICSSRWRATAGKVHTAATGELRNRTPRPRRAHPGPATAPKRSPSGCLR
ncbi:MAG TPA: hypothetical protein VEJ84_09765, partial [Acidimicrobiales bacterium]|nr:hypothetical protein [Acidimicrobiales bacterium]